MIRFYYHPTPNPAKVALMLEEIGLAYQLVPVDTSKGEQHKPEFRAINPNGKVPAIVDTEGPGGKEARVFDSSAICFTSETRPDGWSVHLRTDRSSCRGCSSLRQASGHSRDRRCTSSTPLQKRYPTPSIVTAAKSSAITKCSIPI